MAKPPHNLKGVAALLANKGRQGDTMLAHINSQEAEILKALGGSGTINPDTGLPEYWWGSRLGGKAAGAVQSAASSTAGAIQSAASNVAGAIQSAASAAGSAVSNIASAARGITGAVYDEIGALAQKIGNTVEKIASNPKMLAAVAVNFAFPGAGSAIGNWILGAETAAAIGAAATTAVGNACLNTAMNGGDMKKGIETAVTSYVGNIGAQEITKFVQNAELVPDAFAKNVGTTTSYAAIQAAMGKDPTTALLTGGANACAQLLVQEVPGFSEMPKDVQTAVTKATASALQGKSGGAINAAIDYATKFAKDEYNSYKDANDNGFGYDPTSWKDAKAIGITDPTDYKYAKTVGADNPYDLQVAKAIGAKDSLDLGLAKDIGLSTADDLTYAKQVGVNNKDDYDLAKNVGAQSGVDVTYAKDLGLDTAKDFNYARNVGVNTVDDLNLAKNVGAQKIGDVDYAKLLGIDNSDDFNYAKKVGATTVEDFGLANQTGAKDATDLDVAKQYGITDKDTLKQYSDFLGHGTEKASTTTIRGADDNSELTFDNEGNLVKYTYEGEGGTQDITDEIKTVARRGGGYTIRGDDGSTLTINEDGTVSATDAPDDAYALPGAKRPPISYAKLTGLAAQNRAQTQQTEQGGINKQTINATKRAKAGIPDISSDDLVGLFSSLFAEDQGYYPQEATAEGGEETGSQVKVGGPEGADINYLSNLGGKQSYLGSLEKGQTSEGGELEPGKDAGAGSRGATFGPPVGGGGGGAGFDRYISSGPVVGGGGGPGKSMDEIVSMLKSQGGASQYGSQRDAETDRLMKSLQSAGLQDQSDAETQRLLSAQGPVAIGQVPSRAQPTGVPAMPAAPAAPASTALAMEQQAKSPQTDQLQQLQEYAAMMARSGKSGTSDLLDKLSNYRVFYNPMTGSYNLMDRRLNK